jgi:membrane protein YdbS with pleckstrin-like domain
MTNGHKPCPFCGESIKSDAIKCRFCGEILDQTAYEQARRAESGASQPRTPTPAPAPPAVDSPTHDDDQVLMITSPSLFIAFGAFFWSALVIAAAVYLAVFPAEMLGQYATHSLVQNFLLKYRMYASVGLSAVMVIYLIVKIMLIKATSYTISRDRLEIEEGIFSKTNNNLDMFRIKDLALQRSILDRLVGIGSVIIETSDPSHPNWSCTKSGIVKMPMICSKQPA